MPQIAKFVDIHASVVLGEAVTVWNFCVIMPGVVLADGVSVGSHCYIGQNTIVGTDSRLGQGVHLTDHMLVGDGVFIAPGVITMNDKFPVVNNPMYERQSPSIEDGASIGCGALILPGVRIGRRAIVGAGAVVTRDVPDDMIVRGDPARHRLRREQYADKAT